MFKGFQKLIILQELKKSDNSGYGLNKIIELRTGKPCSNGYIYPLLNKLLAEKHVTKRKQGKSYIYSLTKSGNQLLKSLTKKSNSLENIFNKFQSVKNMSQKPGYVLTNIEKYHKEVKLDLDIFQKFQKARFSTYKKDFDKKRDEFREIIIEATKKLEKLNK